MIRCQICVLGSVRTLNCFQASNRCKIATSWQRRHQVSMSVMSASKTTQGPISGTWCISTRLKTAASQI